MREEEVFQLKGNVGFRADNTSSPRKTELPSNCQTSDNQSSDILGQPFKWTCGTRNTSGFTMDCDQFRRRLYYKAFVITGIINSLFISHLTLKGQIGVCSSSGTSVTWFPRGFYIGVGLSCRPFGV